MEVIDFVGLTELKSGTGTDIGFNKVAAGGIYTPVMLKVKDYDLKDWSPVFTNPVIKSFNLSIGYKATISATLKNSIAIGNHVTPTGDHTVQLGNWDQQVVTFNEIAHRCDERDITDIDDVTLGLDFIDQLRPVKYKSNYRESAIEQQYPFPHPINEPIAPDIDDYKIIQGDGTTVTDTASYNSALTEYERKGVYYTEYCELVEEIHQLRKSAYASANGIAVTQNFVYGFVGSELVAAAAPLDSDFKPTINQTQRNGFDVEHYYPNHLMAPVVKALQEAHALIKELRVDVNQLQTDVIDLQERTTTLETQMAEVRLQLGLP